MKFKDSLLPSMPLRAHLVVFGCICFLPGILAAAYFARDLGGREQVRVETQAAVIARNFNDAVDGELRSAVAVLDALAQSLALKNGRFDNFQPIAEAVARKNGAAITVRRPDGQHLMNTLIPFGSRPLPRSADPVLLAADRHAIETREPTVSNAYVGVTKGTSYVSIIYPIVYDGALTYLLNMALPVERVQAKLQLGALNDLGWSATIAGTDRKVLARTRQPETYIGQPLSDLLQTAVQRSAEGTLVAKTLDGVDVFATYVTGAYGWTTIVSAPLATIEAPARRLMLLTGLTTLGMIALAILLAWVYGWPLGAELRTLSRNATALGEDEDLIAYTQHVTEVSDAQRALFEAKEKIDELLKELNHRVRNTLAIIGSITNRSVPDLQARKTISDRIGALARAHEALSDSHWRGADLCALIQNIGSSANIHLDCNGPDITLTPKSTIALAQVIQELLSNARQHGSLRNEAGTLDISWHYEHAQLVLWWKETSAHRDAPSHGEKAFGMQIIDLCIHRQLNGTYRVDRDITGWMVEITLPKVTELGSAFSV